MKQESDLRPIPFNRPWIPEGTLAYMAEVLQSRRLSGNGEFTEKCHEVIKRMTGCRDVFLAQSCTAALEMASLVASISPGDEVIMPSYTFVSTANAFLLRGAVPVFVDVRDDTLNIDENKIESALSSKTKVIVPVHYAGVPAEMDVILSIAKNSRGKVMVVSDAAQAFGSRYKGQDVCSVGEMSTLSFHETKNLSSGEGGCLMINRAELLKGAHISWEKGTNRKEFSEGLVDKYTWVGFGSSYLPSEVTAAMLLPQLENAGFIYKQRMQIWNFYHDFFEDLESLEIVRRPIIPENCHHNAHMYFLLLHKNINRQVLLEKLRCQGVHAVFHYVPLHSSPMGKRYGKTVGSMTNTNRAGSSLIRLPLWIGLSQDQLLYICETIDLLLKKLMDDSETRDTV